MRTWFVWLVALAWSLALASPPVIPLDAEVFLTAERGTIVGFGRITAGQSFEIRVLQGFSGPAQLAFVAPGEVSVIDVVVRGPGARLPDGAPDLPDTERHLSDGDLLLPDGSSLFAVLRAGGVGIALVWSEAPAAGDRASGVGERPPGIEGSNASDTGRENANPRASEGGNPRSGEDNPGRRP
ncbi:MAG: hypothetical protein ACNA8N_13690 [Trueperaceae bacterium]